MQHYTHIVLGIPHANGQAYSSPEKRWRGDKAIVSELNRWTDWYTHELFGRIRDNVFVVQAEGSRFDCDLERLEHEPDRICRYYYKEKGGVEPSVAFQNEMLAKWFGYRAELMAAAAKGEGRLSSTAIRSRPIMSRWLTFALDITRTGRVRQKRNYEG